ncbi:signal peptidase I [Paenibacillus sp. MBLB4367]|uniref:signal peptidase I n=1 Tax=Paenibacillus sp. MBLB4367 TaxID=3384767 RepID=UPI0039083D59
MKILSRSFNVIIYIIIAFTLTASVGSVILKHPYLISVIRSNSMYPLFERGDMVMISRVSAADSVKIGDIVVFKTETGSYATKGWIIHRIIGGDERQGYITQGDNNEQTDQAVGGAPPIKREWIASKAMTFGSSPVVLKRIGFIPLWAESFRTSPYVLPGIAVILAAILGVGELVKGRRRKKKKKRRGRFDMQLIYVFSGLTLSVVIGATMLTSSQFVKVVYEVSRDSKGVIMGSDVGIMLLGEQIERPLVDLDNKSFIPLVASVHTNDPQIIPSHSSLTLSPKQSVQTTFKVTAEHAGKYESSIRVTMFYPFLPKAVIHALDRTSFWLALAVISVIPGLPIMLIPLFDAKLRGKTISELRRTARRLSRKWA